MATGLLLLLAENLPRMAPHTIQERSLAHAFFIGSLQAAAILPGLSRSGAAFAGGRILGLSRPDALRFSFLMAIPIVAGAVAYECIQLLAGSEQADVDAAYAIGALAAAISGFICIRALLSFVQRFSLVPFAAYCIAIGATASFVASGQEAFELLARLI